jgi:phosphohistidine phosphatase
MELYIIRHGIAEDSNPEGDSQRVLTDTGKKKVKIMAEFLEKKVQFDMLITSPYVRARQTADIFADIFGMKGDAFIKSETLLPDTPLDEVITEINSTGKKRVGVVGHNPLLSELCATLLGGNCIGIDLKKSAVACIDFPSLVRKEGGTLKWLVTLGIITVSFLQKKTKKGYD